MSIRFVPSVLWRHARRVPGLGLAVLVSLLGATVGCGSDEDSTPMAGGGAGVAAGAAGGVAGAAGAAPAGGPLTLTVVESTNDTPIASADLAFEILALDNDTGMPLAGQQGSNDANAAVTFEGLSFPAAFMIKGVPAQAIDTYTFNMRADDPDRLLRVVAKSSVLTVKTVANVTLDPALGDVAGAIYWINAAGVEEPVGCATVSIDDGQGEIRYFASNNLPTTNVPIAEAPNLEVRTATNPLNGKFFITGTSLQRHTITAMVGGQVIGTTSLPAFPGNTSTDGENAISLSDLLVEGQSANPTPADCQ